MVKSLISGAEDDRLMRDRKDTVVITGSGGFIGRALVFRLAESYNVVGFDLQEPKELPPAVPRPT
jgi:nucleoside-diphosphate-sugar epimerase